MPVLALEAAAPPYDVLTSSLIAPISADLRARVADQKPLLSHWNTITSIPPGALEPADPLLDAHVTAASKLYTGDGWRFTRKGEGHVDEFGLFADRAVRVGRTAKVPGDPQQLWLGVANVEA